jgi:hypothetical protein
VMRIGQFHQQSSTFVDSIHKVHFIDKARNLGRKKRNAQLG